MNVGLLGSVQRLGIIFLRLKNTGTHNLTYTFSFICPEEINIPGWVYQLWFIYILRQSCFILQLLMFFSGAPSPLSGPSSKMDLPCSPSFHEVLLIPSCKDLP